MAGPKRHSAVRARLIRPCPPYPPYPPPYPAPSGLIPPNPSVPICTRTLIPASQSAPARP
eukprot:110509-Rhodomonas_salina.1